MGALRIDFSGGFKAHGSATRKLKVQLPLLNGKIVDAELIVSEPRGMPRVVSLRLKGLSMLAETPEARDGMLKERSDESLGQFTTLCPIAHASSLVRALLQEIKIESPEISLELTKYIDLTVDRPSKPKRNWLLLPEDPGSNFDGKKYLLLRQTSSPAGPFLIGWTSESNNHSEIRDAHPDTENLGGGLMRLSKDWIFLIGESLTFTQPPFELVYDAALCLANTRSQVQQVRLQLEGLERYSLDLAKA